MVGDRLANSQRMRHAGPKRRVPPRQLIEIAHQRGLGPETKAGPILTLLSEEYGLGRGHGMAMVHAITQGDSIGGKHVGPGSRHSDPKDHLWIDGVATKPEGY